MYNVTSFSSKNQG